MRKQTKLVAVLSAAALFAIGASMTSFAAGWAQEDGSWVYLDRDGDRVTEEWKKSGSNYYWLDEDGYMATNMLIEDDDDHYYVNENGVRVTNQWVSVDNEDGDEVDGKEVDVLWYWMGSSGKAYKATGTNEFKNTTIEGKRYLFDEDGRMVSGWTYTDDGATYYLGDQNEGWAYTGWQYLEIDEDNMASPNDDYDSEAWFNFKSNGKARKDTRDYVEGYYYTFDENGVMQDEWLIGTPGTSESDTASPNRAYYKTESGYQKTGWVYTFEDNDEEGDEAWFYLINSKKGAAFNYNGNASDENATVTKYINGNEADSNKDHVAAKVIKGKTYLFDSKGKMQTGVFEVTGVVPREGGSGDLEAGIYYFNKDGGSVNGQMETGKTTIAYDGENYVYYFKGDGTAYTNVIKDSCLYDAYGVRVEAEDGNSYAAYNVSDIAGKVVEVNNKEYTQGTMIISASGKVKKSGTATIDGVKYEIDDYFVTKAYDKEDDNKTDNTDFYNKAVYTTIASEK